MKLLVKNIGSYPVERLGFVFEPGTTQEVEANDEMEYLILRAPRFLEVEKVEPKKESKGKKKEKDQEEKNQEGE